MKAKLKKAGNAYDDKNSVDWLLEDVKKLPQWKNEGEEHAEEDNFMTVDSVGDESG